MPIALQYLDFSSDPFHISYFYNSVLLQDFYSHPLAREDMCSYFYLKIWTNNNHAMQHTPIAKPTLPKVPSPTVFPRR